MIDRYRVTVEFHVTAHDIDEARSKAQKLADMLNKKDPLNEAWVPKMVKNPEDKWKK